MKVSQEMKDRVAGLPYEKRIAGAVRMISANDGVTQQQKQSFLMELGFTSTEYLEALNQASNGELVRTALGKDKNED